MQKRREFMVGMFVMIGIAIFAAGVIMFGKVTIRSNYYNLKVVFNNVSNLEIGTPVLLGGVKIGRIDDIYLENDKVVVSLLIKKEIKIRKGAKINILLKGVIGDLIMTVYNPQKGDEFYAEGDTMEGEDPTTMSSLLKKITELGDKVSKLSLDDTKGILSETKRAVENVNTTLEKFNDSMGYANKMMKSATVMLDNTNEIMKENKKVISNSFVNTEKLIIEMKETVAMLRKISGERDKDIENVLRLTANVIRDVNSLITDNKDKFGNAAKNFEEITQRVALLIGKIETDNINKSTANAAEITAGFVEITNDLKKVIKDIKSTVDNSGEEAKSIKQTIKNAEDLTVKIDSILDYKLEALPELEVDKNGKMKMNANLTIKNKKSGFFVKTGKNDINTNYGETNVLLGKEFGQTSVSAGILNSKAGANLTYRPTDFLDLYLDYYDIDKHNVTVGTDIWLNNGKIYLKYDLQKNDVKNNISVGVGYKF